MHEMTLAFSIVRLACDEAQKFGALQVKRVRLEVGVFVAVEVHALQAAFELVAETTTAQGAMLIVDRASAQAGCLDCGHRFELETARAHCPACGSARLSCTGGRECRIVGIDVEQPSPSENVA